MKESGYRLSRLSLFLPIATPADVSMLMQLGVDRCFVGSGIFKSNCPKKRAYAMVQAVTHYKDPDVLAKISEDLGEPMVTSYIFVRPVSRLL
jgi:pyridoxal biosynthesis lyase PdxS